ncbi:MAG: hypothetical protein AAF933_13850 [Pseudomonadota bacterium]
MKKASALFSHLMVLAFCVMLGWGVLGFLEYFFGVQLLMPLQNPTFPSGTQFLHWLLVTSSGACFLLGYFLRWKHTPVAMLLFFTALATLCFVETFDFMTNAGRYSDYARECIGYLVMSVYLLRSERMRLHFGDMETPRIP